MSSAKDISKVITIMEQGLGAPGPGAPSSVGSSPCSTGDIGNVMAGMMGGMGLEPEQEGEYPEFSDEEMRLAKRFLDIVGCPERAQELLDKAIEGIEYLGMVDDEESDAVSIDAVAQAMPMDVSGPSTIAHMVSSFDPNAL